MTTYPLTENGLKAALTALGDTPTAVADTLHAGGYTGRRACNTRCPIAHYLRDLFPRAEAIDVDTDDVTLFLYHPDTIGNNGESVITVKHTTATEQFVNLFDLGEQFTDLDELNEAAVTP